MILQFVLFAVRMKIIWKETTVTRSILRWDTIEWLQATVATTSLYSRSGLWLLLVEEIGGNEKGYFRCLHSRTQKPPTDM